MNRIQKRIILLIVLMLTVLCGCEKKEEKEVAIKDYSIEHETEFGGVYIKIGIDEFNDLGFKYGDSVNVVFDNGYSLDDIPYYNGYYVDAGSPLLIAYPGYEYIKVAVNYGDDLWDEFNLKLGNNTEGLWTALSLEEHNKVTVTLNEEGKYRDIQEACDIHYYDDREKYDSDEMFANFRSMDFGSFKENIIYRSASPCDDQHNRAPYVDKLISEAGVKTVLDLADNYDKIERYIGAEGFDSPYFLSLYEDGHVLPISLSMNYLSDDFGMKIVQGFNMMAELEGPYLIHCTEGKDRTGFVCMLIEALAKASYEEIKDDYMLTYYNYYRINETEDRDKYDTILHKNLDAMIRFIIGDEKIDIHESSLSIYAEKYLLKMGMSEDQLQAFKERLMDQ